MILKIAKSNVNFCLISSKQSKAELLSKIHGLSQWKLDQARIHAAKYGSGIPSLKDEVLHRQRMDSVKMEHALKFL